MRRELFGMLIVLATSSVAVAQTAAPGAAPADTAAPPGAAPAGDLAAPGSGDDDAVVEQELQEAEQKDSRLGLTFLWLEGMVGFQTVGLQTFSGSNSGAAVALNQTGLQTGAGLGVRLVFLRLGARFRWAVHSEWDLWSLGGEAALRIPIGVVEPYFGAGVGYAATTDVVEGISSAASGLDVNLFGGLDVYPSKTLSLGARVDADLYALGAVSDAADGTVGGGLGVTAVVGLHF